MSFVRLHHKGRLIAVNPALVACVERAIEKPDCTYIRFSGGASVYVTIDVEQVLAALAEQDNP